MKFSVAILFTLICFAVGQGGGGGGGGFGFEDEQTRDQGKHFRIEEKLQ